MKKRVVVTGLGIIAPNGIGYHEFANAIFSGKSAIRNITRFDASKLKVKVAAEVQNFDPVDYMPVAVMRKTDRFSQLGLAACKMALDDAKLTTGDTDLSRAPIIIGSGLGGSNFHEEMILAVAAAEIQKVAASSVPRITPNAVSAYMALQYNIKGPNQVISTACSSSAQAIGEAFHRVQRGEAFIAITGGTEAPLSFLNMLMYDSMMVLGSSLTGKIEEASRPFDKTRNGFVMGEGAACLVLEEIEHAQARGAHIHAEIVGFGSNCGAYHMVAPNPSGEDAKAAMEEALKDAHLMPEDIDAIQAHGTSTKHNDLAETRAIKELLRDRAYKVPVSGIKSMIGHTIGASGAIQAVASILCLEQSMLAPTINLYNADPECDLDYIPHEMRKANIQTVMSNSFGFGSNNAVLIFRRKE